MQIAVYHRWGLCNEALLCELAARPSGECYWEKLCVMWPGERKGGVLYNPSRCGGRNLQLSANDETMCSVNVSTTAAGVNHDRPVVRYLFMLGEQ